ncbi:hypothetical protein F2Q70_00043542 [Brassica cretica]|uniref:Uncharacterized protein n=1 Tax=Brassica cretica TaxID=69181 RepID=A0A8S9KJS6_BRACR|nr:hypothetical protein F2Q70_00043542 [Brassica cretica]
MTGNTQDDQPDHDDNIKVDNIDNTTPVAYAPAANAMHTPQQSIKNLATISLEYNDVKQFPVVDLVIFVTAPRSPGLLRDLRDLGVFIFELGCLLWASVPYGPYL